ncbi:MAG: hypothetical protein OXB95_07590, partial [Rhodobacteraceae bacterium]|nr:hypothetical protein [Paracoccaceae bacterium]
MIVDCPHAPLVVKGCVDEAGLIRIERHVVHARWVAAVDVRMGMNESRPPALLSGGTGRVRCIKRAQILRAADRGRPTPRLPGRWAVRCRLSHGQSVVSSRAACSGPQAQRRLRGSAGRARCTLELLCNERVRIADDGSISRE